MDFFTLHYHTYGETVYLASTLPVTPPLLLSVFGGGAVISQYFHPWPQDAPHVDTTHQVLYKHAPEKLHLYVAIEEA